MSESEKESFINFVVSESRKKDDQIGRLQDANDRQSESLRTMQKTLESIEKKLDASQKTIEQLHIQLSTQGSTLKSVESELKKSRREAEKYKSLYEVLKREKFSQTSQSSKYSRRSSGRDDGKDEWDGSQNDKETKVSDVAEEEVPLEDQSSDIAGKDTDCLSGNTQKKKDRPYRLELKSRGRKVLTDFIGESELAALQSDAYNVYTYLDDRLSRVEHICCMAHVRARSFIDRMASFINLKKNTKRNNFPPKK